MSDDRRVVLRQFLADLPYVVPSEREPSTALYHQALYLVGRDEFPAARESCFESIKQQGDRFEAHLLLAWILLIEWELDNSRSHLIGETLQHFNNALELAPQQWIVPFYFGLFLERLQDNRAINLFMRVLELDPSNIESLLKLSRHLFWNEKRFDDALNIFDRVRELRPDWPGAWEKTNFYEIYLQGEVPSRVAQHCDEGRTLRKKLVSESGIDKMGFRFVEGIVPFIGHYGYLDDLIKMRELGYNREDLRLAVLAPKTATVNPALLNYFAPYLAVIRDDDFIKAVKPWESVLQTQLDDLKDEYRTIAAGDYFRVANYTQKQWSEKGKAPLLTLSAEDRERGAQELTQCGMPNGAWFVALHVRDDGFKGADSAHALRNADIHTYIPAIEEITRRGGWVIRMGDAKMVPLPAMPHVIDYARSTLKSDWMDVFLWGAAKFFIGGNSGPAWIPRSFGVPCLRVNWTPLTRVPWSEDDLMVPKLYRDATTGRSLSLSEIIDPKGRIQWIHSTDALREKGISWIDNTPEEIRDGVVEMIEKISGGLVYSAKDEDLQRQAERVIREVSRGGLYGDCTSRFGMEFLRQHSHLFE